jgi:hypothetical protein
VIGFSPLIEVLSPIVIGFGCDESDADQSRFARLANGIAAPGDG